MHLVFDFEVTHGELSDVSILAGRDNEKLAEVNAKVLPVGSLVLEDMGFLTGDKLQRYINDGVYFITRIPYWTRTFDEKGKPFDLLNLLRKAKGSYVDKEIRIMAGKMLKCRLVAVRLPEEEVRKKQEEVRREAKRRGRPVSQKKLDMCEWSIQVTNVEREKLSCQECSTVRRVRWQIELLFKVIKSEAKVHKTKSRCVHRVQTEVYAKLLGVMVGQWVLLAAGYVVMKHSRQRAARQVKDLAKDLLKAINDKESLSAVVKSLNRWLKKYGKIRRRGNAGPFSPTRPSTFERLAAHDPAFQGDATSLPC